MAYLNPDQANAPRPTANVKQIIDPVSDEVFEARYMKIVWLMKALQLKSFLTYGNKYAFKMFWKFFVNYVYLTECKRVSMNTYLSSGEYFSLPKPVNKESTKLKDNRHDEIRQSR